MADLAFNKKQVFSHIACLKQEWECFVYWLIQTGNEAETIHWNQQLHQETFQEGSYAGGINDSIELDPDEDEEEEEEDGDNIEEGGREGGEGEGEGAYGLYGPVATLPAHEDI